MRRTTAGLQRVAAACTPTQRCAARRRVHLIRTRAQLGRLKDVVASQHGAVALGASGAPVTTEHRPRVAHGRAAREAQARPGLPRPRLHVHEWEAVDIDGMPATSPHAHRPGLCAPAGPGLRLGGGGGRRGPAPGPGRCPATCRGQQPESTTLRGAARARALPSLCSGLAESPGESLLRLRLQRMGLEPVEQYTMPWVEGNPRVDFLVEGRLVVEFDGQGSTSSTASLLGRTGRRS